MADQKQEQNKIFSHLKTAFLDYDPAHFIQNNLTLDGEPFRIIGNGWKFMADVYRYVALQASKKDGKPVIIKKGRQVGATMMAGALDIYFTNSGLFVNPPIRVAHLFPAIAQVKRFTQDKLENLIRSTKDDLVNKNKLNTSNAVDNLTMKQFNSGTLWVESVGADADRVRGMTLDVAFFDECFPYHQHIETENGKIKIGKLYNDFLNGKKLPLVKSYNLSLESFEYKQIINAWKREPRDLINLYIGNREIKCTPNHKFLTTKGWKEAVDLCSNDLIISSVDSNLKIRAINDDQKQVALGSFLGDGHLDRYKDNVYRLSMTHGISQKDYCIWKSSILDSKISYIKENGFSKKEAISSQSKLFAIENNFPKTKNTCPQWVLDELDERGMAIWFMDDGSLIKSWNEESGAAYLSTCSFDEDSQVRFVKKFNSLGIKCHYKKQKDGYYYIYFNKDGFFKLYNLIKKYIHPSMLYKFGKLNSNFESSYNWNNNFKNYSILIVDKIVKLEKREAVYDIEVQDNNNFILSPTKNSKYNGGPVVHNCQDMMGIAIGNATKTLTAAKYGPVGRGVQVFFGTPKEKGSWFEMTWEMSDQRYYHLGCKNCQKTFPFYQPNDDGWKKIWISGFDIKCPICGFVQHKIDAIERGCWVPSRNEAEAKYVGFHINQLYIPYLNREYINSLMPENNPNQSERVWNNEVVGEFYANVGMPLTRAHIEAYCKDVDRSFAKKIDARDRPTYLGIDWGDKTEGDSKGQSYSCAVVISDIGDGTLQIEHAHILKERSFQYKKSTINELFKRFSIKRGVSDFFFGQDVVREMQVVDGLGDRFIGAQGSGALTNPIKYREDELMISYNKDLMIEELFDKMRKGKVRFPWKSYEYVEWLIDHCTSMGVAIRNRGGQEVKTYIKGSTPNDGLMSLMYAYMAWKFDSTQGFTIKPGTKEIPTMPKPTLAFAPRLRR